MNKRDKDKLLILLILVIYIGVVACFIFGTRFISWQVLILIMLAAEYLIIQPEICRLYYKANKLKIGGTRFIPFWNEIVIFKSIDATVALISYVLLAVSLLLLFIPSEIVASVLGEKIMFNYGFIIIRAIAVFLLINSVVIGIGFIHVVQKVRMMHTEFTSSSRNFSLSAASFILYFFPILRTISLMGLYSVLNKLVSMNNYTAGSKSSNNLVEE